MISTQARRIIERALPGTCSGLRLLRDVYPGEEIRVVYVDELLPVRRDGRAAFCQVATALWPALVEKARPRRLMSRRWRTATLQPLANAGVRKDFWVL